MSNAYQEKSKLEIEHSLRISDFCMRAIGLSLKKETTTASILLEKFIFIISVLSISYHAFSEFACIVLTLANNPKVEKVVPLFHTFGYGILSIGKLFTLWYKRSSFRQLVTELADIWPVEESDEKSLEIKTKCLSALDLALKWYFALNVLAVWFYILTPMALFLFQYFWQGQIDARIGFVWVAWYPFDKHQNINHILAYSFEVYSGQLCVWIMASSDLFFSAMASHIAMLLKLLQQKLKTFASTSESEEKYYLEIVNNIKLHQRLIRYCNDLDVAFSFSNLVNIVLSSMNICCVVFVIVLLEPFMAVSNKLFLASSIIQIGVICWYGDDILHANADVAVSAYNSGWYVTSPRCRRALQFLIQRAQKPIAFTAMKFTNISLVTYSSILVRSYSYFALLYTIYRNS